MSSTQEVRWVSLENSSSCYEAQELSLKIYKMVFWYRQDLEPLCEAYLGAHRAGGRKYTLDRVKDRVSLTLTPVGPTQRLNPAVRQHCYKMAICCRQDSQCVNFSGLAVQKCVKTNDPHFTLLSPIDRRGPVMGHHSVPQGQEKLQSPQKKKETAPNSSGVEYRVRRSIM